MSIQIQPSTELHPRHTMIGDRRVLGERLRIASRVRPSAREQFADLRVRLLASRSIIGDQKARRGADGITSPRLPLYGKPTFRNVIENGRHV